MYVHLIGTGAVRQILFQFSIGRKSCGSAVGIATGYGLND
jgi:hypothetical protein